MYIVFNRIPPLFIYTTKGMFARKSGNTPFTTIILIPQSNNNNDLCHNFKYLKCLIMPKNDRD